MEANRAMFVYLFMILISSTFSLQPHSYRRMFAKYLDSNKDGKLDANDFIARFEGNAQQAKHFISLGDLDKNGSVDEKEFLLLFDKLDEPFVSYPQQIHLSLTTDPTEMVVMWVTKDDKNSIVQYGTESGKYILSASGSISTYNVGQDGWHGLIHTVTLQNLSISTKYYYKCGGPDNWSDEFSFITPPKVHEDGTYSFAVFGDMGTAIPMGWAVTDQMIRDNKNIGFNMIIHDGDVAYAGTGKEWEFEEIWDIWGNQVQDLAANVPWMFAVGNHEHYYNYTSFITRYKMPGYQSGGNGNFWWSMDYGNTHWVFMSTEHDYSPSSVQYKWLEKDLSEASKNDNIKWIILNGHRPMYCSDVSEWDSHKEGSYFQTTIEPLMINYDVDLYLCGHMHMYERVYPVCNGSVSSSSSIIDHHIYKNINGNHVPHVVQGTGGVFTDLNYINPSPSWSAQRNNLWGYGKLVTNSTHLHYEFINLQSDKPVDYFWIIK